MVSETGQKKLFSGYSREEALCSTYETRNRVVRPGFSCQLNPLSHQSATLFDIEISMSRMNAVQFGTCSASKMPIASGQLICYTLHVLLANRLPIPLDMAIHSATMSAP
jgi:hypothetical protein